MPDAGHSRLADITAHNPFLGNRLDVDTTLTVTSAAVGDRVVRIELSDGTDAEFHFQWLRHSCYCDSCGNPADGIRFATVASFESAVALGRVEVDGGVLCLTWDDGHESRFAGDWLRSHDYGAEGRDRRSTFQPTTWRCELTDDFPTVPWDDAAKVGEGRLRLYDDLLRHGIVRITGVGAEPQGNATRLAAAQAAPIEARQRVQRQTHQLDPDEQGHQVDRGDGNEHARDRQQQQRVVLALLDPQRGEVTHREPHGEQRGETDEHEDASESNKHPSGTSASLRCTRLWTPSRTRSESVVGASQP